MDNTSEKEYDKELSKNLIQYLSNIIDGNTLEKMRQKSLEDATNDVDRFFWESFPYSLKGFM